MKSTDILLVEDNDLDAEAVTRGFSQQKIINRVIRSRDGQEALEYLTGQNEADPLPVILLDLKMPRMDGLELLGHIRKSPRLRRALVFVMTASRNQIDREHAFEMNVAGYILKENAGADFIRVFDLFQHYWEVVELPSGLALELKL